MKIVNSVSNQINQFTIDREIHKDLDCLYAKFVENTKNFLKSRLFKKDDFY